MKAILVIEDEREIREVTAQLLSSYGFVPSTARSLPAALAAIEQGDIDLVLTDICLNAPLDGFGVAQLLKERGWKGKFIFTSGDPEAMERTDDLGEDSVFLCKPYGRRDLLEAIHALS